MSTPDSLNTGDESDSSIEIIVDKFVQLGFAGSAKFTPFPITMKDSKMPSRPKETPKPSWVANQGYQMSLFSENPRTYDRAQDVHIEEIKTTPLFSAAVLASASKADLTSNDIFPQYGLLAKRLGTYHAGKSNSVDGFENPGKSGLDPSDQRLFLNMNAPWSAFICGSQGSGKSHTLSCMLEMALIPSKLGELPRPLAAIVFHYDKFTGVPSSQVCEAAHLCSSGIPVRVLVSESNLLKMKELYSNLPGLSASAIKPVVMPLLLNEKQLNAERMMKLMAVDEKERAMPLYMESLCRIMRLMAIESQGTSGLDYTAFRQRLEAEKFTGQQNGPLNLRLQLLESFMGISKPNKVVSAEEHRDMWEFKPGSLTIVDLSCPFVNEADACGMFNICLALFLETRGQVGRIVALDEAHKFMGQTDAASVFTESLLSVIRQQRHLATRVIVATQEPTISPKLLDLSSMTIVHRFSSPSWFQALKSHLAGVNSMDETSNKNLMYVFNMIVNLGAGQALLFSPSAMLDLEEEEVDNSGDVKMRKLGLQFIKMRVRQRLTSDGGKSILAAS